MHWHPRQSKDLKGTGFSQKDLQNRNHHLDTANSNSWEANPFAVFFIHTILPIDAKNPCSERIEINLTAILREVKALFSTLYTTIRLFPFPPGLVFSSCHLWIKTCFSFNYTSLSIRQLKETLWTLKTMVWFSGISNLSFTIFPIFIWGKIHLDHTHTCIHKINISLQPQYWRCRSPTQPACLLCRARSPQPHSPEQKCYVKQFPILILRRAKIVDLMSVAVSMLSNEKK